MAGGTFGGGTGSPLDPKLVEDAADFNAMRTGLAASNSYKQTKAIDLSPYPNWSPFDFSGTYDGDNFDIINLKMDVTESCGLFNTVRGSLKNMRVVNASLRADPRLGGQVGFICMTLASTGNITNCFASGSAFYKSAPYAMFMGGIAGIGDLGSLIKNCSTDVTLENGSTAGSDSSATGGIIGGCRSSADTTLVSCFSNVNIKSKNASGGLAGSITSASSILNCYSTGTVETAASGAGGIVGSIKEQTGDVQVFSIKNCYSSAIVIGGNRAAGLVGSIDSTRDGISIVSCYSLAKYIGTYHASNSVFSRLIGFIAGDATRANVSQSNCFAIDTMEFRRLV